MVSQTLAREVQPSIPSRNSILVAGCCLRRGQNGRAMANPHRLVVSEGKAFSSSEISKVLAQGYVRETNIRGAEDSYDLLSPRGREIVGVHPPSRCPA